MLKEFREFAVKGNVIDLAVGVVIGGAFGKIVTSMVDDVIMPLVGLVLGKIDFSNLFFQLGGAQKFSTVAAAKAAGVATLSYGIFLNNVVNFLIVAFAIFVVIKQINRFKREEATAPAPAPAAPEPTATEKLLVEIRDLLSKK